MATLPASNTLEGGSDETTITTGNSGGASGTAFDTVTIGAGNGFVYDSAQAMHGALSARVDLGSNPGTSVIAGWTFTDLALETWGYCYFRFSAAWTGPSTMRILGFEGGGGGIARVLLGRVPKQIIIVDQNFVTQGTSSAALSDDTWYRLGWRLIPSNTVGELEVRIFLGDSTTPIEVVQATGIDTGPSINQATMGCLAAWTGSTYSFWMDDANINRTGAFGPSSFGRIYKRLAGPSLLGTSAATVYTVPTGSRATARRIYVNNPTGSPVGVTISIGSDAAGTRLLADKTIPAGDSIDISEEHNLASGEVIQAYADTGSALVLLVDGIEQGLD